MSSPALLSAPAGVRRARPRHFLMCPPRYFDVRYAINPWMDPDIAVDRGRALDQWTQLVRSYRDHGHTVDLLEPVPDLPDMVYAANGATVVDGQVFAARFAHPERRAEAEEHRGWHLARESAGEGRVLRPPRAVNEAEGDFAVLSDRILAGFGFRTRRAAHRELSALTRRRVISLELVDPRFYHLDVALTVLDDRLDQVAYFPAAFSRRSRHLLARLFPDALLADDADAAVLGLNCVSDGLHVWVPAGAEHLSRLLAEAGFQPLPVDLGELLKGGGSVKCCTQEIRPQPTATPFPHPAHRLDLSETPLPTIATESRSPA